MKKLLTVLLAGMMLLTTASATIYRAEDFTNYENQGHVMTFPGVMLCEELPILDARGDQGGQPIGTLTYTGEAIPVNDSWDGYAQIVLPNGQYGWVSNEYLLMKPDWYQCDGDTKVYAYPDFLSPRVALLDAGTILPIITETETETASWVCVSLGGGAGWIRKTPKDTADETWFRPDALEGMIGATLKLKGEGPRPGVTSSHIYKQEYLAALTELLASAEDLGGPVAGCPFGATLTLFFLDGREMTLEVATDSCCVYRVDGRDYQYARHLKTPDSGVDNSVLFGGLFNTTLPD